jgi:uncharacterized BrkB/YihY/UPF0761 family membrane protein
MPCDGCGAALAVDVTVPYAWCAACNVWRPVSEPLRQRAWQYHAAIQNAQSASLEHRFRAAQFRSKTTHQQAQNIIVLLVFGALLLLEFVGILPTVVLYGIAVPMVIVEEMEPWAAALTLAALAGTLLALAFATFGGAWWLYRRATRRRRWAKLEPHRDWSGPEQVAAAVCGECGAPLAFAVGEQVVSCGFCRAVVVASPEHANELVTLALSEAQLAKAQSASAERQLVRARIKSSARVLLLQAYVVVGALMCVALPLLAGGFAWRALTPSLEEALEKLGRELRGEVAAGVDAAYEWLDAFWIGTTPPGFEAGGWLQSRWSVAALFHERPVLISVLGSWSDRVAETATLVLVRPRNRDPMRVPASPAARRIEARGWQIGIDYAGIALYGRGLHYRDFTPELMTELARAAYELAEERS